jgi:PBP1b-binding outer membrane lipoprotein LpoB
MKSSVFSIVALIVLLSGCASKNSKKREDPTNIVVPANSDATNPSLADSAYGKNDSSFHSDSTVRK